MTHLLTAVCKSTMEAAKRRCNVALRASAAAQIASHAVIELPDRIEKWRYLLPAGPLSAEKPEAEETVQLVPMVLDRAMAAMVRQVLAPAAWYITLRRMTPLPTRVLATTSRLDERGRELVFVKWTAQSLVIVDPQAQQVVRMMQETVQRKLAAGTLKLRGPRPEWARPVEVNRHKRQRQIVAAGYVRTGQVSVSPHEASRDVSAALKALEEKLAA